MSKCVVSFLNKSHAEQRLSAEAENLFEAVAEVVYRLRSEEGYVFDLADQFTVVPSTEESVHLVTLAQVEDFALKASGQGERIVESKERVRRLLGLQGDP